MQFKQKTRGKALTKAFSIILTISIIAILIVSGPAGAVTVDLEETSESDGVHKYTAEVDINTDDYIPVDLVAVKLKDSEDTYQCYFDIDDRDFEEDLSDDEDICDMITVTDVDNDIEYDETYGYGYGYAGEKSTKGEVTIKFKIDTKKAPKDNEEFTMKAGIAGLEDDDIEFEYYSDDKLEFTTEKSTGGETVTKTTQYAANPITTKQSSRIMVIYGSEGQPGTTYSKVLKLGDKAYFIAGDDVHSITLTGINDPMAEITVESTPQKVLMATGGQRMFDADGDGKYDILVGLNYIANNKALVTITELSSQTESQITGMATAGDSSSNALLAAGIAAIVLVGFFFLKSMAHKKRRR